MVNLDSIPSTKALDNLRQNPDILSLSVIKLPPNRGAGPSWLGALDTDASTINSSAAVRERSERPEVVEDLNHPLLEFMPRQPDIHVNRNPMRELRQHIRRRRAHHQRLRPLRLADVLN